ncbi:hypothetical protein [Streptomyces sp. NPDC050485]|uniref:hypothetical protein n=1 Tax=Streptomyces sp. NPDC050485 TaxID=3365617 RepID=UPI0037B1C3B9
MFSSLAQDVVAFAAAAAEVAFERVAVTEEQVAAYGLPTTPPKATDRRSFSDTTTLAEALPDILAALVRAAIEAHRDEAVRQRSLVREEAERGAILARLSSRREG